LGPKNRHYIIDRHHYTRALHDEGVKEAQVTVIADLSTFECDAFWPLLDNRSWAHPFDEEGPRHHYNDIPKSVSELIDDPFRSLAGELRRAGGYAKVAAPFSEFRWADFLRGRIERMLIECKFDRAMELSMKMAESVEAIYLPGWRLRIRCET
jgi:hypothetical protein